MSILAIRVAGLGLAARRAARLSTRAGADYCIDASRGAGGFDPQAHVALFPTFLAPTEQTALISEVDRLLRRARYEPRHWDGAIRDYREMFRSKWTDAGNSAVALRVAAEIKKLGLPESGTDAHVLDLHAQGAILPHLDSLEYVGPYIAGISLLSPAIMRLTAADGEPSTIDILLEPGSLYILQCATGGDARYKYKHEVLGGTALWRGERSIVRDRRISILFRSKTVTDGGPY